MQGILQGVTVLDLAEGAAGSIAALQLAEAGAEVIRIEPPGGHEDRGTPGYHVRNRGKKSVVLDLFDPRGRRSLDRLLATADVLIHDLSPRQTRALGLDNASLQVRFHHLIVSTIGAWPTGHPDSDRPARESLVLARLGLMNEQPGWRPGPIFIRTPFATLCAAWLCAIGVLARLIQRGRGGGAGPAHTSLAQGALIPMTMHWARAETPSPSFAKGLDKTVAIAIHQCSDGEWSHVHSSPDDAPLMRAALDALGPDGVTAANARWGKNHSAPNFGANREIFATRPSREWLEHLWAHDVAAQPAAPFGAIHFDEQARANGYVVEVQDPVLGVVLQPGPAYTVTPPPKAAADGLRSLGADTETVLVAAARGGERVGGPPATTLPLEGIRILDFGAYLAGPFGAMLLADLGADVVKVEPTTGDYMRYLDRAFCGCQRGKRGVALQLKEPSARPVVEALVRWADAFHHNMRLPSARKLGLDYDSLRAINPAIVGCHVSSYGPKGPRADWPGYDQMFQSSCGWEVENGGDGNPPMWLRFGVTDHFAALASAFALLLGLYRRDRTGEGQMTAASLLGATMLSTGETVVNLDGQLGDFPRLDAAQTGVSPYHRLYVCRDGWVAVAALKDDEARAFQALASDDPEAWFAARAAAEAEASLTVAGVPCALVRDDQIDAFLDSPDNQVSGLVAVVSHPTLGRIKQIGSFWDLGRPSPLGRAAPALGQHSREVLLQVGLEEGEVRALLDRGVLAI